MMNFSSSSSSIIYILYFGKQEILVYLPLILIIFGVIGFIGNVFTFVQPTLRHNTCCIYLLCASFADVINLLINLLNNYINTRTLNILSLITVRHLCKLKLFGLVFLPQLSMNLLILSLINLYACTCSFESSIRHIRQLKMLPLILIITIIISGVMSLYSPMFYDVAPGFGCVCTDPFLNGIFYIIIHGFMTPFLMLVFVLLTHRNVKESRRRAGPKNRANIDRSRKSFLRMIFTQVFTTSLLTLQWISFYIYHSTIKHKIKNDEQRIVHYFIWSISNNVYYLINVKSFYLSTLTSSLFRKTFVKALCRLLSYYR